MTPVLTIRLHFTQIVVCPVTTTSMLSGTTFGAESKRKKIINIYIYIYIYMVISHHYLFPVPQLEVLSIILADPSKQTLCRNPKLENIAARL